MIPWNDRQDYQILVKKVDPGLPRRWTSSTIREMCTMSLCPFAAGLQKAVEVVRRTHNLQITHRPPWRFRELNQWPLLSREY